MKKVAVMLADGFEDVEALATVDILRRAGMTVDMVSIKGEYVESAHNVIVKADKLIDESLENYDMLVCPGGLPGAEYLSKCELLINTIKKFDKMDNKFIAAICASPAMVLSAAGIEEDRYITSYPGEDFENMLDKANYVEELVVVDGNLITAKSAAASIDFAYAIIEKLAGPEKLNEVKNNIFYEKQGTFIFNQ